ncbi:MAG: M28 family peptidase [Candidatus Rokubacteria bacterium]|nr:M28 family peptidase [Candidatus Rokubacteria bacterium]
MKRLLAAFWAATLLTPAPCRAGPAFDGKAALAHVERVVAFGPRPAGSEALARARRYLVDELKKAGLRASEQPFTAETPDGPIQMANVIAELPGRRPQIILVGGHYDTKFFPAFKFVGANDGGSSSGLLLELAKVLRQRRSEFTYWIVFFDGEEARREWSATDGIYGSRHLAATLRRDGRLNQLRAVIVVDMIGDRRLDIRREATSTAWLTDLLWGSARRLGYRAHFLDETLAVEDDHAPFLRAGIPSALLIDFHYEPYWHTPEDTLDKLSPRSLQIVGDVLLDALPALETLLLRGEPGGRAR